LLPSANMDGAYDLRNRSFGREERLGWRHLFYSTRARNGADLDGWSLLISTDRTWRHWCLSSQRCVLPRHSVRRVSVHWYFHLTIKLYISSFPVQRGRPVNYMSLLKSYSCPNPMRSRQVAKCFSMLLLVFDVCNAKSSFCPNLGRLVASRFLSYAYYTQPLV